MDIEYTEKIPESKWEEIIRNSENSYFFHIPAWAKILVETYGYRIATRLYEIDDKEILVPMMKYKMCDLSISLWWVAEDTENAKYRRVGV